MMRASAPTFVPRNHDNVNQHRCPSRAGVLSISSSCVRPSAADASLVDVETSGGRIAQRRDVFMQRVYLEGKELCSESPKRPFCSNRWRRCPAEPHNHTRVHVSTPAVPLRNPRLHVNPRRPSSNIASSHRRNHEPVAPHETLQTGSGLHAATFCDYPAPCRPISSAYGEVSRHFSSHANHVLNTMKDASQQDDTCVERSHPVQSNSCQNHGPHCSTNAHNVDAVKPEDARSPGNSVEHNAAPPFTSDLNKRYGRSFSGGMTSVPNALPGSCHESSEFPSSAGQSECWRDLSSSLPSSSTQGRKDEAIFNQILPFPVRLPFSRESSCNPFYSHNKSSLFPRYNAPENAMLLEGTTTDGTAPDTNSQMIGTNSISDFSTYGSSAPFAGGTVSSIVHPLAPFHDESRCSTVRPSPPVSRTDAVVAGKPSFPGHGTQGFQGTIVPARGLHTSPVDMPRAPFHCGSMSTDAAFRMPEHVLGSNESGFFAYPHCAQKGDVHDTQVSYLSPAVTNIGMSVDCSGSLSQPRCWPHQPVSQHLYETLGASAHLPSRIQQTHAWLYAEPHLYMPSSIGLVHTPRGIIGNCTTGFNVPNIAWNSEIPGNTRAIPDPTSGSVGDGSKAESYHHHQPSLSFQQNMLPDKHGATSGLPTGSVPSLFSREERETQQDPSLFARPGEPASCGNLSLEADSETGDFQLQFGQQPEPATIPASTHVMSRNNYGATQPDIFPSFPDGRIEIPQGRLLPGGLWIPFPDENDTQTAATFPHAVMSFGGALNRTSPQTREPPQNFLSSRHLPSDFPLAWHATDTLSREQADVAPECVSPDNDCHRLRQTGPFHRHSPHTECETTYKIDITTDLASASQHYQHCGRHPDDNVDGNQPSSGCYRRQLLQQLSVNKRNSEEEGEWQRNEAARKHWCQKNGICGTEDHALESEKDSITVPTGHAQVVQLFEDDLQQKAVERTALNEWNKHIETMRTFVGFFPEEGRVHSVLPCDGELGNGDLEATSKSTGGDRSKQMSFPFELERELCWSTCEVPRQTEMCIIDPQTNENEIHAASNCGRDPRTTACWVGASQDASGFHPARNIPEGRYDLCWQPASVCTPSGAIQKDQGTSQMMQAKNVVYTNLAPTTYIGNNCFWRHTEVGGERDKVGRTNTSLSKECGLQGLHRDGFCVASEHTKNREEENKTDARNLYKKASLFEHPADSGKKSQASQTADRRHLRQHQRYNEERPRMPIYATAFACAWEYTFCPWCDTRSAASSPSKSLSRNNEQEEGSSLPSFHLQHEGHDCQCLTLEATRTFSTPEDGDFHAYRNVNTVALDSREFEGNKQNDTRKPAAATKGSEISRAFHTALPSFSDSLTTHDSMCSNANQRRVPGGPWCEKARTVSSPFLGRRHFLKSSRTQGNKTYIKRVKSSERQHSVSYGAAAASATRLKYGAILVSKDSPSKSILCFPKAYHETTAPLRQIRETLPSLDIDSTAMTRVDATLRRTRADTTGCLEWAKKTENTPYYPERQAEPHGEADRGQNNYVEGNSGGKQKRAFLIEKIDEKRTSGRTGYSAIPSAIPERERFSGGHISTQVTKLRKKPPDTHGFFPSYASSSMFSAPAKGKPVSVPTGMSLSAKTPLGLEYGNEVRSMGSKEKHRERETEKLRERVAQRNVADVTGSQTNEQTQGKPKDVSKQSSAPEHRKNSRRNQQRQGDDSIRGTAVPKPPSESSSSASRQPSRRKKSASQKQAQECLRKKTVDGVLSSSSPYLCDSGDGTK